LKEAKEFLVECYSENPRLKKYPLSEWESALEKEKLQLSSFRGKYFFRLNKEFKNFQAGTVFGKNFFVPGYPSIPRIFVLKTGIKRYLEYPFYAEEKIEGYNIRLAKVEDEIFTFTRRGFVCPFAYDRYADFLPRLPEFFDRFPKCGRLC
jgi:putative ATP-dependent DNA ligase